MSSFVIASRHHPGYQLDFSVVTNRVSHNRLVCAHLLLLPVFDPPDLTHPTAGEDSIRNVNTGLIRHFARYNDSVWAEHGMHLR